MRSRRIFTATGRRPAVDGAEVAVDLVTARRRSDGQRRSRDGQTKKRRDGQTASGDCQIVYGDGNRTELDLLCKMAHTHFTAPLDCPVHSCESIQLTRLDKHLSRVHNLQSEMVTLYMQTAKDRYIARELALLRASRPHPPMVSHIDEPSALSAAEPSDPSAAEPSDPSAAEPSDPSAAEPSDPSAAEPSDPSAAEPSDPSAAEPSDPSAAEPSDPSAAEPSDPSAAEPSDPSAAEPSAPSAAEPSAPSAAELSGTSSTRGTPNRPASGFMSQSAAEPSGSSSFCSLTSRRLFRRNRPVPRTPSVGCEKCKTLAAELKVVRGLLETEIDRNEKLKQLLMTTSRDTAVRYRRQKPYSVSEAPQYVKLVEDFKEHTEGTNPSKKVKENARQRANHVIKFLEFMSKPAVPHLNLLFLKDYSRVRKFAAHLSDRNFRPTTVKSYLTDAVAFVKYVVSMSPEGVKVGHKSLNALLGELRARMRDMARMLLGQQLAHRRKKSTQLVKASHHAWFIENAPARISAALGGYIVAVTGHRKGVLINLTRAEVKEADKLKNGDRIIRVEQHKTARYFGQAAIPLQKREYGWFKRYDCLRSRIEGGLDADTFFHTSSGSQCMKLPEYFKQAWESLELGKAPTFNLLRSSVATYSKRQLGSKAYKRVAAFMCHDEHTAKKFYHAEDPASEVFKSRSLSVMAINTYAIKYRGKDSDIHDEATEDTEEEEEAAEEEEEAAEEEEEAAEEEAAEEEAAEEEAAEEEEEAAEEEEEEEAAEEEEEEEAAEEEEEEEEEAAADPGK
ncbi:hypothetical protein DPEC_G00135080 [Dallia pectoralis]|uniref:Uncharacterized protein n=1 Tax=Dallia pectoralis TaxID=75939 RepID=A0ACC2GKU1_DALPE|nr:hypothetical protein DPEC_G00135080 [Dallia pectoralis]